MKIAIIGAGSWGSALAVLYHHNNHEVFVYTRSPEQAEEIRRTGINKGFLDGVELSKDIVFSTDPELVVKDCKILIFSVPTQAFRETLIKFRPLITKDMVIVNVAKGIEISSLSTLSKVASEIVPDNPFCLLSGPSHAEEVALKMPTAIVSASTDIETAILLQEVSSNNYFRVYTSSDVVGAEISGALKNIIALAAGILEGLGYGDNAKAALITRGNLEITRLGMKMGASASTFAGLTGMGDLIVTCTSMHSRNRRCGILIGQGSSFESAVQQIGMVVEGAYTCKAAYLLSKKLQVDMPITTQLYKVLYEGKCPNTAVSELMTRERKHETDEQV